MRTYYEVFQGTVEAHVGDVPVKAYGYSYIYGAPPDLQPDYRLQLDNQAPWRKIQLKNSREIRASYFGSTPAREPKSALNDDQPLLPVHLIDGDPMSCWCSRGQTRPDVEPVWIRLDLPVEQEIHEIRIVPTQNPHDYVAVHFNRNHRPGRAFPHKLTIKLSCDAWRWETVFARDNLPDDQGVVASFVMEMKALDWVNTLLPFIIPCASPFAVFLCCSYMQNNLPDEVLDSTRVDGCGEFQLFVRIALPMIKPAIATVALLSFLGSWNSYMMPRIMISSQRLYTIPLYVASLGNMHRHDRGAQIAALMMSTIPVLIVFTVFNKSMISGIVSGSGKG